MRFEMLPKNDYLCIMKKSCKYCKNLFIDNTLNKNKIYCSANCSYESKKNRQKTGFTSIICKICGKEFIPKSTRSLCCSDECSKLNKKSNNLKLRTIHIQKNGLSEQMKQMRKRNKKNKVCYECGKHKLENSVYCETHYYKMISGANMKTVKYWRELKAKFEQQNERCYYTGDKLILGINASIDHVIPRSSKNKNVYTIDNLVWCTREVNLAKRHTSVENFMELCRKVSGIAYGSAGVSRADEVGTVDVRSLRS